MAQASISALPATSADGTKDSQDRHSVTGGEVKVIRAGAGSESWEPSFTPGFYRQKGEIRGSKWGRTGVPSSV